MSTENTTEAAPAPAPAPAAAPAPTETPADSGDLTSGEAAAARIAAAMALFDESEPDPETPANDPPATPETPAPAEPKPDAPSEPKPETPAPEGEPPKIPTLDELRAEVAARQRARGQTPEPEPEPARQPQRQGPTLDPERLRSDPVAALIDAGLNPREVLRALAQSSMQGQGQQPPKPTPGQQPAVDIEAKIQAAIDAAIRPFHEREQAQAAAQARQQAEQQFLAHTADAAKYRYLSALSEQERIDYGDRIADTLHAAGRPATFDSVAQTIDNHLKSLAERFATTGSPDPGADPKSAAGSEIKSPAAPTRSTTLSQSLPATPSPKRALNEQERLEAALRVAQAGD